MPDTPAPTHATLEKEVFSSIFAMLVWMMLQMPLEPLSFNKELGIRLSYQADYWFRFLK